MTHLPPEPTMPAREPHFLLILRAALTMPATFSKADLVVVAWETYPHEFGMRAYDFPNSQAVYCKIDGATGLVGRGYLEWISAGVLSVTAAGRKFAAKPATDEPRATYADLRASLVAILEVPMSPRTVADTNAVETARDALRRSR